MRISVFGVDVPVVTLVHQASGDTVVDPGFGDAGVQTAVQKPSDVLGGQIPGRASPRDFVANVVDDAGHLDPGLFGHGRASTWRSTSSSF